MMSAVLRERRIKLFFFLSALILLFVAILTISNLMVSMILGFVTSYMMSPAVNMLERRGLSRTWATVVPFLALTIFIVISVQLFVPTMSAQISTLKTNFPTYLDSISRFADKAEQEISSYAQNIYPLNLQGKLQPTVMKWAGGFFQDLPDYISRSLMVIFLAPFLAIFMLLDGQTFVRQFLSLVPNNFFELALNLNHQVGSQIGGFIRARFIQTALVTLVIWIGLLILGFPYALVLAIFAGILNIIPYLGPLIGILPALLISFANGTSATEIFWIATIYSAAQVLDAVLITPFIVAKIVDLHPVTVILVIIVGSQVMGVLGMIICIPVFSALKVSTIAIYKHLTDFRS